MKSKHVVIEIALALSAVFFFAKEPSNRPFADTQRGNKHQDTISTVHDFDSAYDGHNPENRASPKSIALSFYNRPPVQPQQPVKQAAAPISTEQTADWIKFLGVIKDTNDVERMYLKDSLSGKIMKVRLDGIPESEISLIVDASGKKRLKVKDSIFTLTGDLPR
jgi:hypothetical protein